MEEKEEERGVPQRVFCAEVRGVPQRVFCEGGVMEKGFRGAPQRVFCEGGVLEKEEVRGVPQRVFCAEERGVPQRAFCEGEHNFELCMSGNAEPTFAKRGGGAALTRVGQGTRTGVVGEPRRPSRKQGVLRLLSLAVDSGA